MSKLIIFSAPSGSGKSTIINYLLSAHPELHLSFSISATSRSPRGSERDGVEYFFLTPDEFRRRIEAGEFLEYEDVYLYVVNSSLTESDFISVETKNGEIYLLEDKNTLFDENIETEIKAGCAALIKVSE